MFRTRGEVGRSRHEHHINFIQRGVFNNLFTFQLIQGFLENFFLPQTKENTWPILPTRYGLSRVDADHQPKVPNNFFFFRKKVQNY